MKSFLYAGAALMIGASIYGFVDYKQTHKKKEFREMYAEKKTGTPVTVALKDKSETPSDPVRSGKTIPAEARKSATVKEKTVAPVQPISKEDKMTAEKKEFGKEPGVTAVPSEESSALKTVKKKRKIRKEFFSRAPLRDEEELLIEPVKKEEPKKESKE